MEIVACPSPSHFLPATFPDLSSASPAFPLLSSPCPPCSYVFLNEYSSQFLPILGLLALRAVVGAVDVLLKRMGKKKKGAQEELAEELGRHRAKEYNVPGEGGK
jgi:hypothetical protein